MRGIDQQNLHEHTMAILVNVRAYRDRLPARHLGSRRGGGAARNTASP